MIQQPSRDDKIVRQDMIAQDQFQGWIDSVTQLLNDLDFMRGAGSPEGIVFAAKEKRYFNTTGSAGTLMYVKNTGITLSTGWIAYA